MNTLPSFAELLAAEALRRPPKPRRSEARRLLRVSVRDMAAARRSHGARSR